MARPRGNGIWGDDQRCGTVLHDLVACLLNLSTVDILPSSVAPHHHQRRQRPSTSYQPLTTESVRSGLRSKIMADTNSYSPTPWLIVRQYTLSQTRLFFLSLFLYYDLYQKMSGKHIILLGPARQQLLGNIEKEWMVARKFQRNQSKCRL